MKGVRASFSFGKVAREVLLLCKRRKKRVKWERSLEKIWSFHLCRSFSSLKCFYRMAFGKALNPTNWKSLWKGICEKTNGLQREGEKSGNNLSIEVQGKGHLRAPSKNSSIYSLGNTLSSGAVTMNTLTTDPSPFSAISSFPSLPGTPLLNPPIESYQTIPPPPRASVKSQVKVPSLSPFIN